MENWYWNEMQQIGVDYESPEEVRLYDQRMCQIRDLEAEDARLWNMIQGKSGDSVLEIGTGTGHFARYAARHGANVTALDVSPVMLEYAALRANEEQLDNVTFHHAGFLTFKKPDAQFHAAVSSLVLHHLPDVWKLVALENVARWLMPGGRFALMDVVFSWGDESHKSYFSRISQQMPGSHEAFIQHIAQEYSTVDWIMTGLLEHAGFIIENDSHVGDFLHFYECVKK